MQKACKRLQTKNIKQKGELEKGTFGYDFWFIKKYLNPIELKDGNAFFNSPDFPITSTNFYRNDDVCATA